MPDATPDRAAATTRHRVAFVLGTRPEAIKLAPVILALRGRAAFEVEVCVTAQHRHLLDQVLEVFGIVPDRDLDLMRPGQSLAALTAAAVSGIDTYLGEREPALVLVQGDTTTVFAAALAAFYRGVPVAHVEAGLRTGDLRAPWPEEANRVLTTRLAALHFAPTERARAALLAEGVAGERVFVTGNTVVDALGMVLARVRREPPAIRGYDGSDRSRPMVLVTGHRRESFGAGMEEICAGLATLAERFPRVDFVYPVHPNPSVTGPVRRRLGDHVGGNVFLIEPLSYLEFVALMDRATLILTDSGGVQEEAPTLDKPVLVMRDTTERPEAVAAGTALLVGAHRERIVAEVSRLLDDPAARAAMTGRGNPFGDGHAAARIADACAAALAAGL